MYLYVLFLWYSIIKGCNLNYFLFFFLNLVVDCGDLGDFYGGYCYLVIDIKY